MNCPRTKSESKADDQLGANKAKTYSAMHCVVVVYGAFLIELLLLRIYNGTKHRSGYLFHLGLTIGVARNAWHLGRSGRFGGTRRVRSLGSLCVWLLWRPSVGLVVLFLANGLARQSDSFRQRR